MNLTDNDIYQLGRLSSIHLTEEDVKNGIAVFYIPEGSFALDAKLPTCVIQIDSETGERTPAVAIQAEQAGTQVYLGLRYLSGGNGICGIDEVEQLDEPNNEFAL